MADAGEKETTTCLGIEQNNTTNDEAAVAVTRHDDELHGDENCCTTEERFRIDRKKLEHMLLAGLESDSTCAEEFFLKIGEATDTVISWPSKLKIGAKSKKDPHIKVVGYLDNIKRAKQMIMSVLDTKTSRVTLKMDVSFTDHSHIIGKGGTSIKRVMQDSSCHIHFPDSNRTSAEKSNQVSIAGPPVGVETARKQIRELLPIVLMFEVPSNTLIVPDASSAALHDIAQVYNVSISFKQRPRSYGFIGTVRGLHSDPLAVKNSVVKTLECLTGTVPVAVPVTTQIEIDPKHHTFMIGRNGSNIKHIMQSTGASINFPDPCCNQARRSTIAITGTIESAITAKVMLMECLPLVLMFDIKDDDCGASADNGFINQLMEKLDLLISVKLKPRQESRAIIIKTIERNASNMYIARQQIVGESSPLYEFKALRLPTLAIPNGYNGQPSLGSPFGFDARPYNNAVLATFPPKSSLSFTPLIDSRPSISSPSGHLHARQDVYSNGSCLGSSHSSSDDDHGTSAYDAPSSRDNDAGYHSGMTTNVDKSTEGFYNSWKMPSGPVLSNTQADISSVPNQLRMSDANTDVNLLTASLMDRLVLQQKASSVDYEMKKQLASKAMHSRVTFGEVRTPTDTWSGLGFSKSMPEKALKDVWLEQSKGLNGGGHLGMLPKQPESHRASTSLDSSASSLSSTESTSSEGALDGNQKRTVQGPPPGLEGQKNCMDNATALLTNNNDYAGLLPVTDSSTGALATVVDIADLFNKLGLSKYTDTFQEQEVDLLTFMSLTEEDLRELGVGKFGARRRMVMAIQDLQKIHNIPLLLPSSGTQSPLADSLNLLPPRHISLDVANQSLRW